MNTVCIGSNRKKIWVKREDWEVIHQVVAYLNDRKAEDIVAMDLRQYASIADFFIIATGVNKPQLKALQEGLQCLFKKIGKGYRRSGLPESGWMIVEYYGVMVHIFEHELREFYALEELWKDAPLIGLNE